MTHNQAHHARPPRLSDRGLLEDIAADVAAIKTVVNRIDQKGTKLVALSQAELSAFAALVEDIDAKFVAANAPLIDELKAQIAALEAADVAEDEIDHAEIARLQGLVDTAETDTLAAISTVRDHVAGLGSA